MWSADYQRDYVQVNGYNTLFKNCTGRKDGSVGFYLKEQLQYKVRTDFRWNYIDLEILVVESVGEIKTPPHLPVQYTNRAQLTLRKMHGFKSLSNF